MNPFNRFGPPLLLALVLTAPLPGGNHGSSENEVGGNLPPLQPGFPAPKFVAIDLGPTASHGQPRGVSNAGWVLFDTGKLWRAGEMIQLESGNGSLGVFRHLNDSGDVVGSVTAGGKDRGAVWTDGNTTPNLSSPLPGVFGVAYTASSRAGPSGGLRVAGHAWITEDSGPFFRFAGITGIGGVGSRIDSYSLSGDPHSPTPSGLLLLPSEINASGSMAGLLLDYGPGSFYPLEEGFFVRTAGSVTRIPGNPVEDAPVGFNDTGVLLLRDRAWFVGEPSPLPSTVGEMVGITSPDRDEPLLLAGQSGLLRTAVDPLSGGVSAFKNLEAFTLPEIADTTGWTSLELRDISGNGSYLLATGEKAGEERAVLLLKVDVVPDYDRDGVIREFAETVDGKTCPSDYARVASKDPFHFWINDDDDSAVDSGGDIPGIGTADASNVSVDGIRDLIDFFSVFIDFHGLLNEMDVTKVQIELIGAKVNWLNFPDSFIGLTETSADFYLEDQVKAEEWANASVTQAGEGVYFTQKMVERIRDGRGIVLLEGREAGEEPLTLVFNYDGIKLFTYELPTKLSGVEDMFRHVNLVDELAHGEGIAVEVSDRTEEPAGFPDSENNDQYFAFIHGYNVSQQNARGWNAEIFKRMHWAGSKAKFVGLTWHGKVDPNYHKAIINAFETGDHLASGLSSFPGNLTIAAHSLGNIVVSHAITDGGFSPDRYFMLNAASPIEAYDSAQTSNSSSANMQYNMAHSEWRDTYGTRLWASHWHELFPGEARAELTWRDRFGDLGGVAYNFYSSGEDVAANAPASAIEYVDAVIDLIGNGGFGAWYIQEKTKGLSGTLFHGDGLSFAFAFPDQHGGWRINVDQRDPSDLEPYDDPTYYSELSNATLRTTPVFAPFASISPLNSHEANRYPTYDGALLLAPAGDVTANAQAALPTTQYKLLAEAIPALSFAVATNPVGIFGVNNNFDVNAEFQNGWPQERLSSVSGNDWLHSDLKNIPYVYLFEYYKKFVEIGGFDQ